LNAHIKDIKNHEFIVILRNSLSLVNGILENIEDLCDKDRMIINRSHQVLTQLILNYNKTDPLMINPEKLTKHLEMNTIPKLKNSP